MSDFKLTLVELDQRIAAIEENLRDLVEQAAAYSGGNDEDRSSDRIALEQTQLIALKTRRDQLSAAKP